MNGVFEVFVMVLKTAFQGEIEEAEDTFIKESRCRVEDSVLV